MKSTKNPACKRMTFELKIEDQLRENSAYNRLLPTQRTVSGSVHIVAGTPRKMGFVAKPRSGHERTALARRKQAEKSYLLKHPKPVTVVPVYTPHTVHPFGSGKTHEMMKAENAWLFRPKHKHSWEYKAGGVCSSCGDSKHVVIKRPNDRVSDSRFMTVNSQLM